MKRVSGCIILILVVVLFTGSKLFAEQRQPLKIGMAAILSGDLAVFGQGDVQAARTYLEHYGRHNIELVVEDARLTSAEGLRAYRKLINVDEVDVLIAAGTSNGIMAAKGLIHSSKTPTLMASTGGKNIDRAGPWIFRTGNSDTLNGVQQADYFLKVGMKRVALLSELTEYTTDIADAFRLRFKEGGGELVYDQNFLPNTSDFRSEATSILSSKPDAVFMPTQTGTALGVFIKQLRVLEGNNQLPIHTTMVAAPNPDAHKIAGPMIVGVAYMDPEYDAQGKGFREFLGHYKSSFTSEPAAPFHAASVIDAIELVQKFLDKGEEFTTERFRVYLSEELGEICGYMGCYTLDAEGNSNLGFRIAKIEKWLR